MPAAAIATATTIMDYGEPTEFHAKEGPGWEMIHSLGADSEAGRLWALGGTLMQQIFIRCLYILGFVLGIENRVVKETQESVLLYITL